jgi:hypothetical protein
MAAAILLHLASYGQWRLGGGAALHTERRAQTVYYGPMVRAGYRIKQRWSVNASGFYSLPRRTDVDFTTSVEWLASGYTSNARYAYEISNTLSAYGLDCTVQLGKVKRHKPKGHAVVGAGLMFLSRRFQGRGWHTDLNTGNQNPISFRGRVKWGALSLHGGYVRETKRGAWFIEALILLQADALANEISGLAAQPRAGYMFRFGNNR